MHTCTRIWVLENFSANNKLLFQDVAIWSSRVTLRQPSVPWRDWSILTFFRKEIFAFYPSVCQIGNSSEKSELWGKWDANFTGGNVDTTEQRLLLVNERDSTVSRQKQLCLDKIVTMGWESYMAIMNADLWILLYCCHCFSIEYVLSSSRVLWVMPTYSWFIRTLRRLYKRQ